MMDLITDDLFRALSFLESCRVGGFLPTAEELDKYVTTKQPKASHSTSNLHRMAMRGLSDSIFGSTWVPGEKVSAYLVKVGWIELISDGKVRLTALGGALLGGISEEEKARPVDVTVKTATPENPVALSQILNLLQTKQSELFVDPFLGYDQIELLLNTPISRVLTTKAHLNLGVQTLVSSLDSETKFEIRVADEREMHDRAIVHQNGGVALVGTSLNGTRKVYTSLVDLPASFGDNIRMNLETLWKKSTPIAEIDLKKKKK